MTIKMSEVASLPKEDSNKGFVRVLGRYIGSGKEQFIRKEVVRITNTKTRKKIYREVVGHGNFKVSGIGIGIDYDDRVALGLERGEQSNLDLVISKTGMVGELLFNLNHPDRAVRYATRGNLQGTALGLLGATLGALSLLG